MLGQLVPTAIIVLLFIGFVTYSRPQIANLLVTELLVRLFIAGTSALKPSEQLKLALFWLDLGFSAQSGPRLGVAAFVLEIEQLLLNSLELILVPQLDSPGHFPLSRRGHSRDS